MNFKNRLTTLLFISLLPFAANADWFDEIRDGDDREALYRTLYYMPKGGDLHNHLSGAVFAEWWYELALAQQERGYEYYTKVRIDNCRDYGGNAFARDPYFLLFRNISALEYAGLDACEQGEYKRLADLDEREKAAWMNSIRLDKPWEGREEFFQTHWQRLNALGRNPWLEAETLVKNLEAYAAEGMVYVEYQIGGGGYEGPNGESIDSAQALRYPARDTGAQGRSGSRRHRAFPARHPALPAQRRRPAAARVQARVRKSRPARRRQHGGPRGQRQGLPGPLPADPA